MSCGYLSMTHFGSRAEANRWAHLRLLERNNLVSELRRQHRVKLYAFNTTLKAAQTVGEIVIDFTYHDARTGDWIAEDVKGALTDLSKWKMRHFEAQTGTEIKLIAT